MARDPVRRFVTHLSLALGLVVSLCSIAPSAFSQAQESPHGGVWPAPPERLAGWDWVQLDSGEWIKGEIIGLYDKKLNFDSDHFNELTLDWDDDVTRVLSARSMGVRLSNGETVYGPVVIDEQYLSFAGPLKERYARSAIVAMTVKGERERDLWRTEIGLGGSLKGGNVREKSYNIDLGVARRTALSRFSISYKGAMDETDGVQSEESHRANSRWDRFIGTSLYWTPGYIEYYRDRFQNIDARATYGVFIGYYLIDNRAVTLSVSGGPGYQYQEFTTAPAGQDLTQETGAFLADANLKWDITDDITYYLSYEPQFTNEETGRYKHYLESSLSLDITDRLELDLTYSWNRTEKPQVDENGELPEKNDYTLTIGLTWNY